MEGGRRTRQKTKRGETPGAKATADSIETCLFRKVLAKQDHTMAGEIAISGRCWAKGQIC